ncbi:MAG: hypothetical protein ACREOB_04545 [Thermodesulfobacteriota bacterium]
MAETPAERAARLKQEAAKEQKVDDETARKAAERSSRVRKGNGHRGIKRPKK